MHAEYFRTIQVSIQVSAYQQANIITGLVTIILFCHDRRFFKSN